MFRPLKETNRWTQHCKPNTSPKRFRALGVRVHECSRPKFRQLYIRRRNLQVSVAFFHDPNVVINGKIQAPTGNRSTTVHPSLTMSAGEQVWTLHRREGFFFFVYVTLWNITLERGGGASTVSASCVEISVSNLSLNASRDFCVVFLQPSSRILPSIRSLPVFSASFRINYFLLVLSSDIVLP